MNIYTTAPSRSQPILCHKVSPRYSSMGYMLYLKSQELGYRVRCRNARDSIEGMKGRSAKDGRILAYRANQLLMEGYKLKRGSFHLPKCFDGNDTAVISKFRELVRYQARHKGIDLHVYAYTHAEPHKAHYDVLVAYRVANDLNLVRTSWRQALAHVYGEDAVSERKTSYVQMKSATVCEDKLAHEVAYLVKDGNYKGHTRYVHLKRKDGGLRINWFTKGFWGGTTQAKIWEGLKPKPATEYNMKSGKNEPENLLPPLAHTLAKLPLNPRSALRATAPIADRYSLPYRKVEKMIEHRIVATITNHLPEFADHPLPTNSIARMFGISSDYVQDLLTGKPGIISTDQGYWFDIHRLACFAKE